MLIGITGTMVTVIALLPGLTVVALQLSSTQFSPRLLRNFLRDRPNQVVLSACVATFAYSAAGLYTVGISGGDRTVSFPRLAVTGALVMLFVSLGLLVFFADHLVHSIQVDAIMAVVQRDTVAVVAESVFAGSEDAPEVPAWAVPVAALRSGYVQLVHPDVLLSQAASRGLRLRLRPRVGEHVVAGTTLAWGRRRRATPLRIQMSSHERWMPQCGSASSARWNRTPLSGFASWSTSRARRCPRRSTILIPRSRPLITCRSSSAPC